ncbi:MULTISPECIES: ATP-binding protein [unclassified Streptomyces]|uniref:ATP-binding protein n=1 Tax=unclassified Streptomyces TaxID=2593676 RepID=UPI002251C060|nr:MULTISPECIES: ATP-binding protein [unclassified Streptomyces]MCX5140945.1 ATP-binding protein [Streptomyces sp. NBC_00338]
MNAEITPVGTEFVQRFSATRRGARLARRLAVHELDAWGVPYGSGLSDDVALIVGELATNAVAHGRVPGRDFELRLTAGVRGLRIEVSDARGERWPELCAEESDEQETVAESGYGLRLVEALAAKWGVTERVVGKTVWAEVGTESGTGKRN